MGRSRQVGLRPGRVQTIARATIVGITFLTFAACSGGGDGAGDVRTTEQIDAEIAALRSVYSQEPTTRDNAVARALTVRDWANRLTSSGEQLSYGVFADASAIVRAGDVSGDAQLERLENHVFELDLRASDPSAIGQLRFEDTSDVVAGSWTTVEQTYVVGTRRLEEGARIVLSRQAATDMGVLQAEDPAAANFVSVRSTSPEARFIPEELRLTRLRRSAVSALGFVLEGGPLAAGQSLTVVYGRKSGGSPGLRAQTTSTDSWQLPLLIDFDGSGRLVSPRLPSLRVVGAEPQGVVALAPSIVGVGETFDLHVRTHDRWLNRASGDIPPYVLTLNGDDFADVPTGSQAISVLRSLRLNEPGIYRFGLESRGSGPKIRSVSHPIWVVDGPSYRVLWGELHTQGATSDGQGTLRHAVDFARDDSRLDFVGLTDSDLWLDDARWRSVQQLVESTSADVDLLTYLGYEWAAPRARGGHHSVLFKGPAARRVSPAVTSSLQDLYDALGGDETDPDDVLVIAHADVAGDWRTADPDLLRFVEVASQHGAFEWFGNIYAQSGHRVGFVGGSGDRLARPGMAIGRPMGPRLHGGALTAAIAAEKARETVWEALRSRATYSTSGERILLEASLNGQPMGSSQPDSEERRVAGRVSGTAAIDHIDLIKNGLVIYSRDYADTDLSEDVWIQVGFESQSEVHGEQPDDPRPTRVWSGSVRVEGALITEVSSPSFDNSYRETLELEYSSVADDNEDPSSRRQEDDAEPQIGAVRFRAETRGNVETFLLRLAGISSESRLVVELEPEMELGFSTDAVRRARSLPGETIEVALHDLADGRLERPLPVDAHTDRVTFQVIDREASQDLDFEFVDVADPRPGDYYYVRITQVDGATAWTSPFWVGN